MIVPTISLFQNQYTISPTILTGGALAIAGTAIVEMKPYFEGVVQKRAINKIIRNFFQKQPAPPQLIVEHNKKCVFIKNNNNIKACKNADVLRLKTVMIEL